MFAKTSSDVLVNSLTHKSLFIERNEMLPFYSHSTRISSVSEPLRSAVLILALILEVRSLNPGQTSQFSRKTPEQKTGRTCLPAHSRLSEKVPSNAKAMMLQQRTINSWQQIYQCWYVLSAYFLFTLLYFRTAVGLNVYRPTFFLQEKMFAIEIIILSVCMFICLSVCLRVCVLCLYFPPQTSEPISRFILNTVRRLCLWSWPRRHNF
jgi:hypothetical protein